MKRTNPHFTTFASSHHLARYTIHSGCSGRRRRGRRLEKTLPFFLSNSLDMEEEAERERLEGFLMWAAELGVSDSPATTLGPSASSSCLGHSLAVSYFPDAGGRGLAAARDLKKGQLVLRVPKSALLTRERLMKDETLLSFNVRSHPYLSPTQILAVCLLYEIGKGRVSSWYPYLLHLPRSYDILATFSEFDKQALQVEDAVWTAEKAISRAESEWKEAYSLMEGVKLKPQLLSFKAWVWASGTISSRTLHIPWDEAGCLCPVGDLFNYAAPGLECSNGDNADELVEEGLDGKLERLTDGGFNEEIDAYCFYARDNYRKGEQVLLSYGTYTNLELLEHYGFLLNGNPNDKVFIPLEPNMCSSSSWPKESMYIRQDGRASFALLAALRLRATPANQRRSIGHLAYSGCQLSVENEVSVMKWILNNCHTILKNLPTDIEGDGLLLSTIDKIQNLQCPFELGQILRSASGGEFSAFLEANRLQKAENNAELLASSLAKRSIERWRLAVQWRFRYKKIILDCISRCTEVISSLSNHNILNVKSG